MAVSCETPHRRAKSEDPVSVPARLKSQQEGLPERALERSMIQAGDRRFVLPTMPLLRSMHLSVQPAADRQQHRFRHIQMSKDIEI